MGTWAHGSFDNDDAMDWFADLVEARTSITEAFDAVSEVEENGPDYLRAVRGLAAAEVVASMWGRPSSRLPEEVIAWLAGKVSPGAELVSKARWVVERIRTSSELKDLWAESPYSANWQQEVEQLLQRLNAAPN